MTRELIPYGQLPSGRLGVALDDITGDPIGVAIEVKSTLPLVVDAENFDGRLVFEISSQTLFLFKASIPEWFPLEGIPVEIGVCSELSPSGQPRPPVSGSEQDGEMFFCTDSEVTFVWDGSAWQPIGGRFSGRWVEQKSISTGFAGPGGDTFALGVTPVNPEFVEVFLDGVRQIPNPGGDYNVIGNNAVFPAPVSAGVEVFTRTFFSTVLEGPSIQPNVQITDAKFTATVGQITFDAGRPALDPTGTFVFVNGILQCGGGVDYTHSTTNTTINSITKVATTTARATTLDPHGTSIGAELEIQGVLEPEFTGTFIITAIPSATQFEFTVLASAPASGTPDPVIFYTPPFINDEIIFTTPMAGGEIVQIRALKSIVTAPPDGEANTASNLGAGFGLFDSKVGEDLKFKSLEEGPNITMVDLGSSIQISSTVGATFEGRNGINTNLHTLQDTESYIGVRNTSFIVTIDVSTVPSGTSGSGRRVVIVDESGGAGTNNILISHTGVTFSGVASPLVINTNFGSKTIVFDGSNWHVVAET